MDLSTEQRQYQASFRTFVDREIVPHAAEFDSTQNIPRTLIKTIAREKFFGALLPSESGGLGLDFLTFSILNEEFGRGCSSVRSLLTVHSMVSYAILRWGNTAHKDTWIGRLASGESIGAFALTEPAAGSDAASIETSAKKTASSYVINGEKKWITGGEIADLFLVFAKCDGKPTAFLIERDAPGLTIKPIRGMLGTRASMLAKLQFNNCEIPATNRIGGEGFGIAAIALSALEVGRLSVASGCVGIAQACLAEVTRYTGERKQYGVLLKEHQLIRRMVTNMITNVKAARLLCYEASHLKDLNSEEAALSIWIAKYFAARTAMDAASDAVQIHGANGCSADYPVERYLRDAKVMEIIEGSTQIQQLLIAESAYQ